MPFKTSSAWAKTRVQGAYLFVCFFLLVANETYSLSSCYQPLGSLDNPASMFLHKRLTEKIAHSLKANSHVTFAFLFDPCWLVLENTNVKCKHDHLLL